MSVTVEPRVQASGKRVWRARWRDGGRGSRQHSKTFELKRDADRFADEVRRRQRLARAGIVEIAEQKLADLVDDWWTSFATVELEKATLASYALLLDLYVLPWLGDAQLSELTTERAQLFRASLEAAGVGAWTVRRTMFLVQGILQRGVEWGRLPANHFKASRKPTVKRRRAVRCAPPATVEEIRGHLLARQRVGDATLVGVLAYTGMRPEEALALEVRHIRERTILVEQKNVDGDVVLGQKVDRPPRTVDLLAPLREDLAEWLLHGRPGGRALVFPRHDGGPWRAHDYRNWRRRIYAPVARACGIERPRPYDLRHSFASLLLHAGRTVVEIAEQLGHSPQTCLADYQHVIAELKGEGRFSPEDAIRSARATSRLPIVTPQAELAEAM